MPNRPASRTRQGLKTLLDLDQNLPFQKSKRRKTDFRALETEKVGDLRLWRLVNPPFKPHLAQIVPAPMFFSLAQGPLFAGRQARQLFAGVDLETAFGAVHGAFTSGVAWLGLPYTRVIVASICS